MESLHSSANPLAGRKASARKLLTVSPLAAAAAAGINSFLYGIGAAAGIMDPSVLVADGQSITLVPVIVASVLPSLGAGLVLAELNRFVSRPFRVFNVLALVLLLLSFVNTYVAIENVPGMMAFWLNLMHVVVAGVVVYAFNRWGGKE